MPTPFIRIQDLLLIHGNKFRYKFNNIYTKKSIGFLADSFSLFFFFFPWKFDLRIVY